MIYIDIKNIFIYNIVYIMLFIDICIYIYIYLFILGQNYRDLTVTSMASFLVGIIPNRLLISG